MKCIWADLLPQEEVCISVLTRLPSRLFFVFNILLHQQQQHYYVFIILFFCIVYVVSQ